MLALVLAQLNGPPNSMDADITFPDSFLLQNGGPVINVKRPPPGIRAAKGDGKADDTEAIRDVYDWLKTRYGQGGGFDNTNHYYVYFPNGTYRVSDTLIYRGPTVGASPNWDGTFDFNHLHFLGQNRQRTVIRLADGSPGFDDPAKPKPVLCFQHPDTVFNNVPGSNWLRNMTLAVGANNRGAAALYLQGANNSDLRELTVRAAPGSGRYGIWNRIGSIQGYYHDVEVQGFEVGYRQEPNAEASTAWELLTLRGQRKAGLELNGGGASLTRLKSVQKGGVPAVAFTGGGTQLVMRESTLDGDGEAAIRLDEIPERSFDLKGVEAKGYGRMMAGAGLSILSRSEAIAPAAPVLWTPPSVPSIAGPDTPRSPWGDPKRDWAVVDDYPSVQAAMDSGKPIVVFRNRKVALPGDVRVPASVQVVRGMAALMEGGRFVVSEASDRPVQFEETSAPIRLEAKRGVVQRRAGGGVSNPQAIPTTIWLENVNDVATGNEFCPPGTTLFARQIDVEYANAEQIVVNGGRMWVFGFKTENGTSTPFTVRNGGQLEVLGGYMNATAVPPEAEQRPMVKLEDAGPTALTFQTNLNGGWNLVVRETRNGQTRELRRQGLSRRGGPYADDISLARFLGGG